jgi:hypothetical protein
MIGWASRIHTLQDRLAHLQWQLVPHRADGVAHLVGRLDHVLLEVEDDDDLRGLPSRGRGADLGRPAEMLCSGFSMRLTISRSTVSGEAPGYGMLTTSTGCSTSGSGSRAASCMASQAQAHQHDDDGDRRHRLLDAEVGKEHGLLPDWVTGCWSCLGRELGILAVDQDVARVAQPRLPRPPARCIRRCADRARPA